MTSQNICKDDEGHKVGRVITAFRFFIGSDSEEKQTPQLENRLFLSRNITKSSNDSSPSKS